MVHYQTQVIQTKKFGYSISRTAILRAGGNNIADGSFQFMTADQIVIDLADDLDVTDLKPILDRLNLRVRMFNRKDKKVVVGVLHTGISAVPDTIQALHATNESILNACTIHPDWIEFKQAQ